MGLKKYIIFSLLLIIAVAAYAFSLESNEYSLTVLEQTFTFPIAVWIVLPAVLLFAASVLHILFYGFKHYLKIRAIEKDEANIVELIRNNLLENKSKHSFKTKAFKDISNLFAQITMNVNKDSKVNNDELNDIVTAINDIQEGIYVPGKKLKFNRHGKIAKLNLVNKINAEIDYAVEVVKKHDTYPYEAVKIALLKVIDEKSMTTIKKVLPGISLDKEITMKLFEKDSKNSEFSIKSEEIKKYAKNAKFEKDDYLELAALYKKSFQPDETIVMFEEISTELEVAVDAYLFILFEYEMIDKARDLLRVYGAHEFTAYRALIDLKDSGRNYTIESLSYKN